MNYTAVATFDVGDITYTVTQGELQQQSARDTIGDVAGDWINIVGRTADGVPVADIGFAPVQSVTAPSQDEELQLDPDDRIMADSSTKEQNTP